MKRENAKKVRVPIPPASEREALRRLRAFKPKLEAYREARDYPAEHGTSGLSVYLKNGSITAAQVIDELNLRSQRFASTNGPAQFLKEIACPPDCFGVDLPTTCLEPTAKNGGFDGNSVKSGSYVSCKTLLRHR